MSVSVWRVRGGGERAREEVLVHLPKGFLKWGEWGGERGVTEWGDEHGVGSMPLPPPLPLIRWTTAFRHTSAGHPIRMYT